MILQAYDFYELYKNNKCILQIGGRINGVILWMGRSYKKN